MNTKFFLMGLLVLGALLAPSRAVGQETEPADDEGVVMELTPQEYVAARYVDFGGELGLDWPFLSTLGQRIEAGRTEPDPVGLAGAAKELEVAERAAGKQARLTSGQLQEEAAELAMLRGLPEELRSVALLLGDELAATLKREAAAAEDRLSNAAQAEQRGERTKGIRGNLTVKNYSRQAAKIYYNGYRLGTMPPYSTWRKYIGDFSRRPYFVITAYGSRGGYKRKVEYGSGQNYTFVIRPKRSPGRIMTIID